jgi:hypothetical protein
MERTKGCFAGSEMRVELCGSLEGIVKEDFCKTVGELVGDSCSLSQSQ